ncbi:MAG TPA: hypothetical protein VK081_03840 [Planctomycetota bacterium]|nr:hypothetical protein [Planctomycetota bacterium]
MFVASLHRQTGDPAGFQRLQAAFVQRNPGYRVWHARDVSRIDATESLAVFFHRGAGTVRAAREESPFAVGDVALLRPGETLATDAPFDAVLFALPFGLPRALPTLLRPDHDPRLTDQPGGCADAPDAYRRVLLTWQEGPSGFVLRGLNTHRVRMDDSLSHYHPHDVGHDELYLVQDARPGAAVLHSDRVDRILAADTLTREEARSLIRRVSVATGDLVYIPRGEMHRAVAGVLAHVIAVPGFRPGGEVPLDAALQRINARLGLAGHDSLPVHVARPTAAR